MQDITTREAAVAELRKVSTPELEALRREVPTTRTSDLISYVIRLEQVFEKLGLAQDLVTSNLDVRAIAAAAMLAIGEEIDRRIPVPEAADEVK